MNSFLALNSHGRERHATQMPGNEATNALLKQQFCFCSDMFMHVCVMFWSLLLLCLLGMQPPFGMRCSYYCCCMFTRNTDKPSRSDFAELVRVLSSPITDLLSWSKDDISCSAGSSAWGQQRPLPWTAGDIHAQSVASFQPPTHCSLLVPLPFVFVYSCMLLPHVADFVYRIPWDF